MELVLRENEGMDAEKEENCVNVTVCVFVSSSWFSAFLTFMVTAHRSVKFSI